MFILDILENSNKQEKEENDYSTLLMHPFLDTYVHTHILRHAHANID